MSFFQQIFRGRGQFTLLGLLNEQTAEIIAVFRVEVEDIFKLLEMLQHGGDSAAYLTALLLPRRVGLEIRASDIQQLHKLTVPVKGDDAELCREKTAVFLTISDTDRAMDGLASVFYTQALNTLCASADKDYPDHRLPMPVRFILDDFATNVYIPDFDKIISVIRSREIYASVILQSISQLTSLYGQSGSMTIVNNCDNCLYLGGQDVETAKYIAIKANKTADTILNLPLGQAYLFTRGRKPRAVTKYDVRSHEAYRELPEAAAEALGKEGAAWGSPDSSRAAGY